MIINLNSVLFQKCRTHRDIIVCHNYVLSTEKYEFPSSFATLVIIHCNDEKTKRREIIDRIVSNIVCPTKYILVDNIY